MHPSANPVETFMKPLGKTMKITHNKVDEKCCQGERACGKFI